MIYFHKDGYLRGMVTVHVDDFQSVGDVNFRTHGMDNLAATFTIRMLTN